MSSVSQDSMEMLSMECVWNVLVAFWEQILRDSLVTSSLEGVTVCQMLKEKIAIRKFTIKIIYFSSL